MPGNDRNNAPGAGASGNAPGGGVKGVAGASTLRKDPKTIEFLNLILKNELTAINQYFLHSRMLANWGVSELSKKEYEESIDEMRHADSLTQRILFLGGLPNLQYLDKLLIGETVEEVISCDLTFEYKALGDLREAIAYAESIQDYGTRTLYEGILKSEEEHIDYLQTQQRLISVIGLTDYIQVQTQPNAANALKPPGD
jgi:bacterioferritin